MNSRPAAANSRRPSYQIVNEGAERPPKIPRLNSYAGSTATQGFDDAIRPITKADKNWSGIKKETEWDTHTPQSRLQERDGFGDGRRTEPGPRPDYKAPEPGSDTKDATLASTSDQKHDLQRYPLLSFPIRPGTSPSQENAESESRQPLRDSATQPFGLELPAYATVLPGDKFWRAGGDCDKSRRGETKVADFFCWQANHAEDTLTEQVVKSGFFDKSQNIQHETNTARPSLWSHLKNKQGLQTLSSLLVTVLEKRQHVGLITSGSTFKPPPRITMTDTRRETWLRDLANPDVPVRRQSKHVPHGIKGKALLEQCLNKNIPIPRAVWLVKCIGANEIRGLKRRGVSGAFAVGGEVKWVKEWTGFVQQFMELLIGLCGQQHWQSKMQYGTRLATQIFGERLLDRDQYLDWLLSCFESTKNKQLPIWLLLVQIYWKHLVSNRQRGKRLAESLLNHLNMIFAEGVDTVYRSLIDRLQLLLATLAVAHRGCLILPDTWQKYNHLFQMLKDRFPDHKVVSACKNVEYRNKRLVSVPFNSLSTCSHATRALVARLDAFTHNTQFGELSSQCLGSSSNKQQIIGTLLAWASSKCRSGTYRMYLAVRLLRRWRSTNVDVDGAILLFLRSTAVSKTLCPHSIFRTVTELVRSGHFSIGRYLQWLISEGCLIEDNGAKSFHLQLLAELPSQQLPAHITNLKRSLLQQTQVTIFQDADEDENAASVLAQRVPNLFTHMANGSPPISTNQFNVSGKLGLGRQLRQRIRQHTKPDDLAKLKAKADSPENLDTVSAISNEEFCASRSLLEDCSDYAVLADVLDITSSSNDESVLASITDTLRCHAQTFAAIGAFSPVSQILVDRYCSLRMRRPTSRTFLLSLRDLVSFIDVDPRILPLVERDLARCDRKTVVAVCSPVSDTNEVTQYTKVDSNDEIERTFASGTTMDEPTMSRLFQKITHRFEQHLKSKGKDAEPANLSCWLYWLRTFDEKKFELLVHDWLLRLLEGGCAARLYAAFCSLAGAGCLSLESLVSSTAVLQDGLEPYASSEFRAQDKRALILNMLVPANKSLLPWLHAPDAYRLRVCQQVYCEGHAKTILSLIGKVLRANGSMVSSGMLNDGTLGFVMQQLVRDSSAVIATFEASGGNDATKNEFQALAGKLIEIGGLADFAKLSLNNQVTTLVESADDLSLPLCVLALRQLSRLYESNHAGFVDSNMISGDVFSGALEAAVAAGSSTWPDLLQVMPLGITQKVREHAEDTILSLSVLVSEKDDSNAYSNGKMLEQYLSLVEATSQIPASPERALFADAMTRRLKDIAEIVAKPNESIREDAGFLTSFVHTLRTKRPWIEALLHLVHTNRSLFFYGPPTTATDTQKRLVDALAALLREPRLQADSDLVDHVFDVLATFVDRFLPDLRAHCAEVYAAHSTADSRLVFLFGSAVSPDAWLALAHPLPPPPPPPPSNAASTSTTAHTMHAATAPTTPGSMAPPPPSPHGPGRVHAGMVQTTQQQQATASNVQAKNNAELVKTVPFVLNRWELLQAPPPVGENDTSLSLSLFGARLT
ncbi:MAG: RNA polymerase II mediator complex subunit [Bathelium mastoideum]|nr:MAG: RNA polymerase II mediator complex subunit [Bathelium mastoideum]KAI9689191.1 MAG: RNA polymerase II mediator complex subunit [Bathelium mastoideum]